MDSMDDKKIFSEEEAEQLIPQGQITLREYLEDMGNMRVSEALTPETGKRIINIQADFKEGMDQFVEVSAVTLEKMLEASLRFEKMRPLLQVAWEAHPKNDPFLDNLPVHLVTLPIQYYLKENSLEEVKQETIEAHRLPFLQFFHAFVDEWKTLGGETRKDENALFGELGEALRQKGLIKKFLPGDPGMEIPVLTPDFIYGLTAAFPTSKLMQNQLMIAKANGRIVEVDMGGEGEENAKIQATITTSKKIPAGAIGIQNAMGELIQANGNKQILVTPAQIWRAFAGLEVGAKVTEQNQEFVCEMVTLLAEAKGRIDFRQQVEKHKKLKKDKGYDYKKAVLEGPLVMRDEITVMAGGHETKGFTLYRQPLYYLHSHLTNQIARIDRALLDTTTAKITDGQGKKHTVETRNNDLSFVLLKRHLLQQVEQIKSEKAKTGSYEGRRNFESIYEAIGLESPTPKQIRTLRADIELLCRRWKAMGYIKGHKLYPNRGSRAYAGVEIQV